MEVDNSKQQDGTSASKHIRGRGTRIFWWVVAGAMVLVALSFVRGGRSLGGYSRHGIERGFGASTLAEFQVQTARATDLILDRLGATEQQRQQIRLVADQWSREMAELQSEGRKLHDQFLPLVSMASTGANGGSVDERALTRLREQAVQMTDRALRQSQDAFVRISQVLTPEQRRRLGEEMARGGHANGWRRRG